MAKKYVRVYPAKQCFNMICVRAWSRHVIVVFLSLYVSLVDNASAEERSYDYNRILSIGGSVSEIVFALGEQDRLIARDTTSLFPEKVKSLPNVGYIRELSPEGVLSVNPDLILALEGSGPPETMETLKNADIPIIKIPHGFTAEKISEKILAVGLALEAREKAILFEKKIRAQLNTVAHTASAIQHRKKVLLILSLRGGKLLVAGKDTAGDGLIALSGGENIASNISGYMPISDEAVITAQPDLILITGPRGDTPSIQDEEIFSHPAIAVTPAGKSRKLMRMDALYMLGFGPRTAKAASDLHDALYANN